MQDSLIDEARAHAQQRLLANGSEIGLVGSSQAYRQVWARDSMICGLGLLLCDDPAGAAIHQRSLETLGRFQSPLGKIPHNVGFPNMYDPALVAHGGKVEADGQSSVAVEDTIHAGCVDGNLWYIIGHYYNYTLGANLDTLRQAWPSLERALLWLRYQDSNECGLLEVHEAMDWADLFANRYNVLEDPDFIFISSSAAFYAWVEQINPAMFEEIRERVREGRWEIVGGWWVQPDCNIPGGESFVRQGLYGQRYFLEKFGVMARVGYNVDSFGHHAMLPQILKQSGMDYYVFTRPSPQEKGLPSRLFWWE